MSFYRETLEMLEHYFPDAHIDPFPLIWFKSDNTGILPDPRRGPRRIYETAFYFSIGDRLITRATNNVVACAANKEQARHLSEKPRGVLSYFFKMFIDENTSFFDPCCGAGSSLEAAELAGAESIQGWDVDPEYVTLARELLTKSRIMRSGGLEILADMKKNATDTSEES
jgi:DNA modification methylase